MMFWGCFEEVMILRSWEDVTFVCSVGECFNKHQQKYNIKMMVEDVRELICEMALCRSALQTMSQRAHLQEIFFSTASPKHHFHYHMRMFLRMFWGGDDFKIIKRCYTFCLFCRGTEMMVKTTSHANIRVWQVKVYKNRSFVLSFAPIWFLTAFSTVIPTEGWWRLTLILCCKPWENWRQLYDWIL